MYSLMAKKNDDLEKNVPGRRRQRGKRLTTAIWAYVDENEKALLVWAANMERRALSSWISECALERAHELARIYENMTSKPKEMTTRDALKVIKKPKNPK